MIAQAHIELVRELEEIGPFPNARVMHNHIEQLLVSLSWDVEREFRIDLPHGRVGFIDLYAERSGVRAALELDRSGPRSKSIAKLHLVDADIKLQVLRVKPPWPFPTITGIGVIYVRQSPELIMEDRV